MTIQTESFGDRLRRARKRLDISQVQLAERSGTSQSAISLLEADERVPSIVTARRLATALDTTVGHLVDGEKAA